MVGNRERLAKLFKSRMYRTGWFIVDDNGEGRKGTYGKTNDPLKR